MARPLKYTPDLADKITDMFRDGSSITKVSAVKLGIHRDTYYAWKKKFPEFGEAARIGELISEAFHEDLMYQGITGQIEGFMMSGLIFTMKCRFRETYNEDPKKDLEKNNDPPIVINSPGEDVRTD